MFVTLHRATKVILFYLIAFRFRWRYRLSGYG